MHEEGQRLACIVLGKTCGMMPPGLNPVWDAEPATLALVMRIVQQRLKLLVQLVKPADASWQDASRLARTLSVGQALSSRSFDASECELVLMPAVVWLDAGRLAHRLRDLVPAEMDDGDKPGCVPIGDSLG